MKNITTILQEKNVKVDTFQNNASPAPAPAPEPKPATPPSSNPEPKKKGIGFGTFIIGAAVLIVTAGAVNMMRNKN